MSKDESSSDSETETDAGNSFTSSNTGSSSGTPRSTSSNESSLITSPRSNLLWDHGYDVAKNEIERSGEMESDWRRFNNKTDDDKLVADKCARLKHQSDEPKAITSPVVQESNHHRHNTSMGLPDLIPSSALRIETNETVETESVGDFITSSVVQDDNAAEFDLSDVPPPLPLTSPPNLNTSGTSLADSDDEFDVIEERPIESEPCVNNVIRNADDCETDDYLSDNGIKTPISFESGEESSSAEGDITSDNNVTSDDDNEYRKSDHDTEVISLDTFPEHAYIPSEYIDDVEAEFDFILQALSLDTEVQNTYIERFSGRRDRHGFILSPIVEAPSPTPSSLSGYSGYSGISCSSPDPFGVFRMSPGPNRGSRQELDLSSLSVGSGDIEINDRTVPIYQTVQAKKAIVIPDGYGWESGDDLLSPRSTGEWDTYDNGLSTPPVTTDVVNFTQFGTHLTGWKLPDVPIYEEPEDCVSDTTVDDSEQSDNETDDTVEGKRENEEYEMENENKTQTEQYGFENEMEKAKLGPFAFGEKPCVNADNLIPNERANDPLSGNCTNINDSPINVTVISLENSLNDSCQGFNAEIAHINSNVNTTSSEDVNHCRDRGENLERNIPNDIECRVESVETLSATEDDDERSEDSCEDAEDEYSESDNESDHSTKVLANVTRDVTLDYKSEIGDIRTRDKVSVTEIQSPRSPVILSGGMIPLDTDTSVFSSSDDDLIVGTPEPNMSSIGSDIKISQYTSGDSDDQKINNNSYENSSNHKNSNKLNIDLNEADFLKDEPQPLTIHSSLDISLLDSSFENIAISDIKKSPRIFGRYYTDMDEHILEKVQSKTGNIKDGSDEKINKCVLEPSGVKNEDESSDDSFQNVQLVYSPRQSSENVNVNKGDASDSEQDTHSSKLIAKAENSKKHMKDNVESKIPKFDAVNSNMRSLGNPVNQVSKPKGNDLKPHNYASVTMPKSEVKKNVSNNGIGISDANSNKRREKFNNLKKPVNVQVSHLPRKDSARRGKIKRGYVHEISALFDKTVSKSPVEIKKSKISKKAEKPIYEEPATVLTPNDDIVFADKIYTPETTMEDEPIGSLGFEVTPLQRVESFENILNADATIEADDKNNRNAYEPRVQSDKESSSDNDQELKDYVEQLKTIDNEIEIREKCETDYKNKSTDISGAYPIKSSGVTGNNSNKDDKRNGFDYDRHSNVTVGTMKGINFPVEIQMHEQRHSESERTVNDEEILSNCDLNTQKINDSSTRSKDVNDIPSPTADRPSTNLTEIMWRIPWKTRQQRKEENRTKKSSVLRWRSGKTADYFQNLIARINDDAQQSTTSEPNGKCDAGADVTTSQVETASYNQQNELNDGDIKTEPVFVEEKELSEIQDIDNTSAIRETGEFGFLDSPTEPIIHSETATFEGMDEPTSRRYRSNDLNIFDESQFEIRYPSSLSRRLYGPYCRLRGIKTDIDDENEFNSDEGEATLECVSPNYSQNRQSYPSVRKPLRPQATYDKSSTLPLTYVKPSRKVSFSDEHSKTNDYLSINQDREAICPVGDSPSSIHILTQPASQSQHEGSKFNTPSIINEEINRADRDFENSENNFVTVTQSSDKLQSHLLNEAERDKQNLDFSQSTYYSNKRSNSKCNTPILSSDIQKEYCNSVENWSKHEQLERGNDCDLGVDNNMVNVKNRLHQSGLGVHIPRDNKCNDTKPQDVSMNNDRLSSESEVSTEKTNLPGINYQHSPKTTHNKHSHQLMSSGNEVDDDKRLKNGDDVSAPEGESECDPTSVALPTSGYEHVLEDEYGRLRLWPYSDFDNSDKLPVTLHRARKGVNIPLRKGMSDTSASMTVIQSAEHSAEMPENRVVQKYHTSSILPADQSSGAIMKAHGESVQNVILQDDNGNPVSEEDLAAMLPKIAESISKMENSNAEEILPGITQSITKLKNGGNLVITTMTRKLDEEESGSSGRGSPEPEHPVLNVDDLENSKIFLVQDSKGELFYVEDVTSETQESAYFSSRHTSESISESGNSPIFDRISKIQSVGKSGINDSTAQEILGNMYGDSDIREITENEEEWSERTYEYELPKKGNYSKDAFKTSYMVEEPGDTMPRMKSATTTEKHESSYKATGGSPWIYDGGMSQSYSQVTQGVFGEDTNSVSAVSTQNAASSPVKTIERYTIEAEATDYPLVPPPPMFLPTPPMVVQTDTPQFSLVKVDVTPRKKDEGVLAKIEPPPPPKPVEPEERLIYKTVATIHTPDKLPAPPPSPKPHKKYKIIASKATEEEEQETHMRFDEIDYRFSAENYEYKMRQPTAETQYFVRNSTQLEAPKSYRSEKKIELSRQSDQKYKSEIKVQESKPEVYEQSTYTYDQMKSELQQSESNMRVVRGSYLIKNTLDGIDGDLDDNINMFDGNFTMCKDNPLYKSDEDIYMRIEREKQEENRRQEQLRNRLNQDITFDTVDRFSKTKKVRKEPEKKISLYELLMSRLSAIDTTHIKQNIDVKHHSEEIYGDPSLLQADGQYSHNVQRTNDFDTVGEKVDLMIKGGKAFITVKVTAERITPVDIEFNVWRKNQAIVTRTIEVDLLATEKRRRLYYKVMETPGGRHSDYSGGPNETVLDSEQTLDLFTKILGAADGEGDYEDIEVRTRAGRTSRPDMDLLY
ncbi:hypothetical protein ACF0H5_010338 [Mactra antiquata]